MRGRYGKGMNRLAEHFPLDAALVCCNAQYLCTDVQFGRWGALPQEDRERTACCRFDCRRCHCTEEGLNVHEGSAAWLKTYVVNPLFVRFVIGTRSFHVDEGCISCGICGKSCPVGNIRLVDGHPVWGKQCIHCMACLHFCPRKVIQYGKSDTEEGRYRLEDYLCRFTTPT